MAEPQKTRHGYPIGWTGVIARRLANKFDVSEATIRRVAKGEAFRKDILDAVNYACELSAKLKNI